MATRVSTAVISLTRSGVRLGSCRTDDHKPRDSPEIDIAAG
jgi:hypothetical protein